MNRDLFLIDTVEKLIDSDLFLIDTVEKLIDSYKKTEDQDLKDWIIYYLNMLFEEEFITDTINSVI